MNPIRIGDRYTLTKQELELSVWVVNERCRINEAAGVVDRAFSCDRQKMIEAYQAEIAFARLASVEYDISTEPRSATNGTDRGDCVVNGMRIDVKHARYRHSKMFGVRWKKAGTVDWYSLMVGCSPTYEYRGSMSSHDFISDHRLITVRPEWGPTYAAEQSELTDLPEMAVNQ